MALPTTPEMQAYAARAVKAYMIEQERTLRDLLGQWVSELEPVVIYRYWDALHIAGIGIADDPTGMIVIENPNCPPPSSFRDALNRT